MSEDTGFKVPRILDKYTTQARVIPALLVLLPLVLAAIAWDADFENAIHVFGGIFVTMGAVALLAHLARTAGKHVERSLLRQWGGWPSTIMLRHRDNILNPIDKQRYHAALSKLVPGIKLPTYDEEQELPASADHAYEACCTWLKSQTVDEHRFHRLFAENMSYGFRRNLYGLRKFAFCSTFIGLLACAAKILVNIHGHKVVTPTSVICFISCVALGVAFVALMKSEVVRAAADDYATRLLAAIDELSNGKTKTKSRKSKDNSEVE